MEYQHIESSIVTQFTSFLTEMKSKMQEFEQKDIAKEIESIYQVESGNITTKDRIPYGEW